MTDTKRIRDSDPSITATSRASVVNGDSDCAKRGSVGILWLELPSRGGEGMTRGVAEDRAVVHLQSVGQVQ